MIVLYSVLAILTFVSFLILPESVASFVVMCAALLGLVAWQVKENS
jgi:hypothetical protein